METATAIQMENATMSHGKVHQRCHKSKAHRTTGTETEPRPCKGKKMWKNKHFNVFKLTQASLLKWANS